MAVFNGSQAELWYDADGAGTWTQVVNIVSIDAGFNVEEIDTTHNSTSGYKTFLPGDMDGTFNFTLRYDPSAASHAALISTIFSGKAVYYWRITPDGTGVAGDTTTGINWHAQGFITSFGNAMQHSQGSDITFTVRLTSTITLDATA